MLDINVQKIIMILKIVIGSVLAIFVAQILHLDYSLSAGVITLLTIQNTKRLTFLVAKKRIISFIIAMIYVYLSFLIFGYTLLGVFSFLLLFTITCFIFKLQDGLSMCTVLMTHFYMQQSIAPYWFKNATLLMIIGTSIGIIVNLYMPRNTKRIKECQVYIEKQIKHVLMGLSDHLLDTSKEVSLTKTFQLLESYLKNAQQEAYVNNDNLLLKESNYYIEYIEMRKKQVAILKYMDSSVRLMNDFPKQAKQISKLLFLISNQLHEFNNGEDLLKKLDIYNKELQLQELPISRSEFEDRALLYNLLTQTKLFLELKRSFVATLSDESKQLYWSI
ncbi:MAG: aromatic acid exporter family protein [Coprobacillaceae bacterium]